MPTISRDHLVALAHQNSADSRKALGTNIVDQFAGGEAETVSERERALMLDILHKVVADVEMSVRKRLSESLADAADVPPALIRLLADDEIEVAYPVLMSQPRPR